MIFLSSIWVILWVVLALAVVALALYRRTVASHEVDVLHVSTSGSHLVARQTSLAQRIDKIDFWGKALTIILVVYGFVLAGWILYQVWEQGARAID